MTTAELEADYLAKRNAAHEADNAYHVARERRYETYPSKYGTIRHQESTAERSARARPRSEGTRKKSISKTP